MHQIDGASKDRGNELLIQYRRAFFPLFSILEFDLMLYLFQASFNFN